MTKLEDNQKIQDLAWILLDSAKLQRGLGTQKDKSDLGFEKLPRLEGRLF